MSKKEKKPQPYIKSIRPTTFITYPDDVEDITHILAKNILYNNIENLDDPKYNATIDEVFYIIYKSRNNKNIFKQYLCEILDGKHYYNIFNTNFFIKLSKINLPFFLFPLKLFIQYDVYVPFFFIIALVICVDNVSIFNLINDSVYFPKIKDIIQKKNKKLQKKEKTYYEPTKPTEVDFYKDFTQIIDIFKTIFKNQSNVIMKGTTHTNREIVENIIDGCLLYVPYVTDDKILPKSPSMFTFKIKEKSNIFKIISDEAYDKTTILINKIRLENEPNKRREDNPNESSPSQKQSPQKQSPRKKSPSPRSPPPSPQTPSPSSSQTRKKSPSPPRQIVQGEVSYILPKKKTLKKRIAKMFERLNPFTRTKKPESIK